MTLNISWDLPERKISVHLMMSHWTGIVPHPPSTPFPALMKHDRRLRCGFSLYYTLHLATKKWNDTHVDAHWHAGSLRREPCRVICICLVQIQGKLVLGKQTGLPVCRMAFPLLIIVHKILPEPLPKRFPSMLTAKYPRLAPPTCFQMTLHLLLAQTF